MDFAPLGAAGRAQRLVRLAASALAPVLMLGLALGGCKLPEGERPPPPTFALPRLRTARTALFLAGAAEPGAKIVVTRQPALAKPLDPVWADAATAHFALEVPLEPERENVFTAIAVDQAGKASLPATVTVVQERALPTSLALYLLDARPQLGLDGKGALRARASLRLAEEGLPLAGYRVRFAVAGYPEAVAPVLAVTDQNGVATATLAGLGTAAGGSVEAVALDTASTEPDAHGPVDSAHFEMAPGLPTSLALELSAPGAQPGTQLTIPAGTDVLSRATLQDAAGNAVAAPVALTVVPDAFVAGGVLRFVKAGTYQVTARVERPGSLGPLLASGQVTVQPDTGGSQNKLQLFVSLPADLVAGEPAQVELKLVDPAGNQVTPASVTATLDAGMAFDQAARRLTSQRAGTASLTFKADRGDGVVVSALPVRVRTWPAPARTLELTLGGSAAPLASPRAVSPGQELLVGATAKDLYGNQVPNPQVLLSADPDVVLLGRTLLAPAVPGLYTINGQVDGTSARALVAFSVQPSPPATVSASCPTAVDAGATFSCTALVQDAAGNTLGASPATQVTWTVEPPDGSDVQAGRITLRTAGVVQVVGQLPGGGPRTMRSVTVRPGAAATLRLTVSPDSVAVGQTAQATVSVVDAFLNEVAVPVELSTDAPGALVGGGIVSNLRQPGTYQLFARTAGQLGVPLLSAQTALAVTSAPSASVRLSVAPATTAAGVPVQVTASVLDAQGNPAAGTAQITVDGQPADQVRVQLAANGQLVLLDPGTHRVTATVGEVSDSRLVDVRPLPDTTAPEVTLLVEGGSRQGALQLFKPGQTVQVSVRARDAGGLGGVRVRASSSDLGVLLDQARPYAQPRTQSEELFTFTLPADRVGAFTVTASASDQAGNAASTSPQQPVSDFHFDRIQFGPGAAQGAVARSVSIDPLLLSPTGLAVGDGNRLHVINLPPSSTLVAGGSVQPVGAGGLLSAGWDLGTLAGATQLAPLTGSAGTFLFTGGHSLPDNANVVERLAPGIAAPQDYTTPPLSVTDTFLATGVAVDARGSTKLLYAAELQLGNTATVRGRISSMLASAQPSGYAVNPAATSPREVQTATFAEHRIYGLCLPDGATTNELYFVAIRVPQAGVSQIGLYKLALTSGQVPGGAATPVTIYEEPRDTLFYGGCQAVTDSSGTRLVFTRWSSPDGQPAAGGKVQSVPTSCAASCQAKDVATGATGAELGSLWGVLRQGSSLYVSESQGRRVLRLDGVF